MTFNLHDYTLNAYAFHQIPSITKEQIKAEIMEMPETLSKGLPPLKRSRRSGPSGRKPGQTDESKDMSARDVMLAGITIIPQMA